MKETANPEHYKQGPIECIDAIEFIVKDLPPFEAHLIGSAIAYLWRCGKKGQYKSDILKTQWYINKLVKTIENEQERGKSKTEASKRNPEDEGIRIKDFADRENAKPSNEQYEQGAKELRDNARKLDSEDRNVSEFEQHFGSAKGSEWVAGEQNKLYQKWVNGPEWW